jgi:hypothetical protein
MKIRLVEPNIEIEVELVGKVKCTRAVKHDMSWEFQEGREYSLYKEHKYGVDYYIVFNDESGWYSIFRNKDNMGDTYYDFTIIN